MTWKDISAWWENHDLKLVGWEQLRKCPSVPQYSRDKTIGNTFSLKLPVSGHRIRLCNTLHIFHIGWWWQVGVYTHMQDQEHTFPDGQREAALE